MSGGKFKETGYVHWLEPNTGAANESGFTALPGGYRANGGEYLYIGNVVYLWSSTELGSGTWPTKTATFIGATSMNEMVFLFAA